MGSKAGRLRSVQIVKPPEGADSFQPLFLGGFHIFGSRFEVRLNVIDRDVSALRERCKVPKLTEINRIQSPFNALPSGSMPTLFANPLR